MAGLPKRFDRFLKDYPEIATSYENMGDAIHRLGPLNDKERALVKIALAIGLNMEGAVHAQVRKGIKAGLSKKEIRHIVLLAIPTIGFPPAMAAMSWVDDILDKKKGK